MLPSDALSQLKGLKTEMEAAKERAEAVVKGTPARYGFAVLDDGREVFIPPDEMLKVFPEDRVRVCIRPADEKRRIAEVEKLLDSPLGEFNGQCVRKGNALFVRPDAGSLQRWLFLPPHARNGAREGDYLRCAVLRHPIRDGKPQAKVLRVLGNPQTPGIENLYTASKHGLRPAWEPAEQERVRAELGGLDPLAGQQRLDLTHLGFVSIDSARTLDIDDALYADTHAEGWTLYVAIADPDARIGGHATLRQEIAERASSVYFHGDVLPMLPEVLSQDLCALSEGDPRPALVCRMTVAESGELRDFDFQEAVIRSRAKLSYFAVDRYLAGEQQSLMSYASPLEALYQAFRALLGERERTGLLMEDRREYRWVLDERKQIDHVEPVEKLISQRLVEECMVAANRCAAAFLARHGASGPFVAHPGFRRDRAEDIRRFLELHLPELAATDVHSLEGYRQVMQAATAHPELPLRSMLNRLLTRAELSTEPAPHMGMGLALYANCTSPLRKYVDYLTHRQIKAILHGQAPLALDAATLDALSARQQRVRGATLEAERWLAANYLRRLAEAEPGAAWPARIHHINSSGFGIRLEASGLEGFVDLRKDPEKFSFDKWQATLTSTTRRFQLEQSVAVVFAEADTAAPHQCRFVPAAGCGLKAPAA
jgi:ribonuclease R